LLTPKLPQTIATAVYVYMSTILNSVRFKTTNSVHRPAVISCTMGPRLWSGILLGVSHHFQFP